MRLLGEVTTTRDARPATPNCVFRASRWQWRALSLLPLSTDNTLCLQAERGYLVLERVASFHRLALYEGS